MQVNICPLRHDERDVLDDFLYEAIFVPDGTEKPPRGIVNEPELRVYYAAVHYSYKKQLSSLKAVSPI